MHAQTNPLQKNIQAEFKNIRIDKLLEHLEKQSGVYFSYNTHLFKSDSLVSVSFKDISLKNALDKLFKSQLAYTSKDNYLILVKAPKPALVEKPKKKTQNAYLVSGYITDSRTGTGLAYASVYDTASLASAISNVNGFFQLTMQPKQVAMPKMALAIHKKDYLDTLLIIQPAEQPSVEVALWPRPIKIEKIVQKDTLYDTVTIVRYVQAPIHSKPFAEVLNSSWLHFIASFKQRMAALNISIGPQQYAQISIIPGVGTHGALSSAVTYHFSLNVFGGYTGGVRGFEAGSLFNINRDHVVGGQTAGLVNVTGGRMKGFQGAGLVNMVYQDVKGLQAAGLVNIALDSVRGGQTAGLINLSKNVHLQAAGLLNVADTAYVQAAGFMNVAKHVQGTQIAGFINKTHTLEGVQIGVFNFADSTDGGIPIGFLSFVKNGLKQWEISANDFQLLNVAYRTGVDDFYTFLTAGAQPIPSNLKFLFGMGIGHCIFLNRKTIINAEAIARQIHLGNWRQFNNLYTLQTSVERAVKPSMWLFVGGAWHINVYDRTQQTGAAFATQVNAFENLYEYTFTNGTVLSMWFGATIGLRFN